MIWIVGIYFKSKLRELNYFFSETANRSRINVQYFECVHCVEKSNNIYWGCLERNMWGIKEVIVSMNQWNFQSFKLTSPTVFLGVRLLFPRLSSRKIFILFENV